jgi:hypothetical protein
LAAIFEARSESEAVRQYVDSLQRAISAFGENVFFVRGGFHAAVSAHTLSLTGDASIALVDQAGDRRLRLRPQIFFRTAQMASVPARWTVRTVGYGYRLDDRSAGRQLIGYHWHPHVQGATFPHVHLLAAPAELSRLHIAVPHCTLKHVLEFAMRDFAIQPVRNDWQVSLDEADAVLRESMGEGDS